MRDDDFDDPTGVTRSAWTGRLVALVAMTLWAASVAIAKLTDPPTVLHLTVILFHEAGHVVFGPFGETMGVAGGTIGQLLMPAICAIALIRRGDAFGGALCCAWMAMSLMDAAVYAYDAASPVLPLIGGGTGEDSFHDFIYLFDRFGQLGHARAWARGMRAVGAIGALVALAFAAIVLLRQRDRLVNAR